MTGAAGVRPRDWSVPPSDVLLADGTIAVIRIARPRRPRRGARAARGRLGGHAPAALLLAEPGRRRTYVHQLFDDAHTESVALVAVLRGRVAALATAELFVGERAEVAFLVSDEDRGRGLGSLLLEHLAALCREHGVTRFEAEVLADNYGMLGVFRGGRLRGVTRVRRTARCRSSCAPTCPRPPWTPRTAASGAPRPGRCARCCTRERRRGRRTRTAAASVAPCSTRSARAASPAGCTWCTRRPTEARGCRRTAYARSPTSATPSTSWWSWSRPTRSLDVMADAAAAGVGAAIIVSSGFTGPRAGGAAERELLGRPGPTACAWSVPTRRACSPRDRRTGSTPPSLAGAARAGRAGDRARSRAGSGSPCSTWPATLGVGVHSFVSLGAKLDVSSNDLLAAWMDDDQVDGGGAPSGVVRQRAQVRPDRPPLRRAQAAAGRGRRSVGSAGSAESASTPSSPRRA